MAKTKRKFIPREPKLFWLTRAKGGDPEPVLITGFKAELSGNLMLYNNRRLLVLRADAWVSLKQANFEDPFPRPEDLLDGALEQEQDAAEELARAEEEAVRGTEPA